MVAPLVVRLMPVLDFGGVESRIALQASMSGGASYRLRVATLGGAGAAAEAVRREGVVVDDLQCSGPWHAPSTIARLTRYLRDVRPALVHSSIIEANLAACFATPLLRIPLIAEEVGQPSHSWKARQLLRLAYRVPRRIVAVSKVTERYLIEKDGAPNDRVRQIYNCAHPRFFPVDRAPSQRENREGPIRFLAVGRLHHIKNQTVLIQAMGQLRDAGLGARLTLIGDGPLRDELTALRDSLGLEDTVRFAGFTDSIRDEMLTHDCFVLPSLSEGCSISLIESMASGLPSIGTAVPGICEVMGTQHAADWTFPTKDPTALATLLSRFCTLSPQERWELGGQLQRRAYESFSPKTYLSQLDDLYASILKE